MTVEDTANLGCIASSACAARNESQVIVVSDWKVGDTHSMKWARVLLWAVGAAMCVVGILLFTDPIDVFDHVGQPRLLRETEAAASSPTSETPQLAPPDIAAQQREGGTTSSSRSPSSVSTGNPSAAAGATRGFSCSGGPFLLLRQESRIS